MTSTKQPFSGGDAVVRVEVRVLEHAVETRVPERASASSAGWDLPAALATDLELAPMQRALVPTGIQIAVPPGYEAQVRPRSGRALREGLALVNSPGTIDSDYRGEVGVIVINLGQAPVVIRRGDRIAQLVIAPVPEVEWVRAEQLGGTERGSGGFGSTGR